MPDGWTVVQDDAPGWTRIDTRRPKTAADVLPQQPYTPAAAARSKADTRPFAYLHDVLKNVPGDLLEQAKNTATGTYDLLSVLARATEEVGNMTGNAVRETIGLQPSENRTENLSRLAGVFGGLAEHYKQYLDPEQRALRVQEHPVGTVLDLIPVAKGGEAGARLATRGAKATASAVKAAPARAIDTVLGAVRGSPIAAVKGAVGHGPVNAAVQAAKAARSVVEEATPAVAPKVAPAATPAPAAPTPVQPAPRAPAVAPKSTLSASQIADQVQKAAAKARVDLSPSEHVKAFRMVRDEGVTAADAVAKVGGTPRPVTVPAAGLQMTANEVKEYVRLVKAGKTQAEAVDAIKAMRAFPGSMTPEQMESEIANRVGNRSPTR